MIDALFSFHLTSMAIELIWPFVTVGPVDYLCESFIPFRYFSLLFTDGRSAVKRLYFLPRWVITR